MNDSEQYRTDDHERCTLSNLVIDIAEEWRKHDSTIRKHRRNGAGNVFCHAILDDHELGRKLEEWENTGIEHKAEQGNIPETLVAEQQLEVRELESFLWFGSRSRHCSIFLLVHDVIYDKRKHTDAEHCRAQSNRG